MSVQGEQPDGVRTDAHAVERAVDDGAIISRLQRGQEIIILKAHTVIEKDDCIQAVGSEESLNNLALMLGSREEGSCR